MNARAPLLVLVAALIVLSGCGVQVPSDPNGTLARVSGGVLTVGVSHNPPWTDITGDEPAGTEVELVQEFAESIDAEVEWEVGGEERVITLLGADRLDMVIGWLTAESPWTSEVALTTSYTNAAGPTGADDEHVMAVRMGENAFMVELERFLLAQELQS